MRVFKKIFCPRKIFFVIGIRGGYRFLNDKSYLKLMYYCRFGKKLNLKNPESFNEKIQWLKLNDRNPLYTKLVDKYEVKKYVSDKIGEQYVIPTLGIWNSFDKIDFESLPDKFVLKCTHDSGGLVICHNKDDLNILDIKNRINKSLKRNYYWAGREWPYKNVKPRVIAENYMENAQGKGLVDYKFYCFNGQPQFLYISEGLDNHKTARISFLKMNWENEDFQRSDYLPFEKIPIKPDNFDHMVALVKELAADFEFIRVDMYSISGKVYFSELTFYPCSGFMLFSPADADDRVGDYLKL